MTTPSCGIVKESKREREFCVAQCAIHHYWLIALCARPQFSIWMHTLYSYMIAKSVNQESDSLTYSIFAHITNHITLRVYARTLMHCMWGIQHIDGENKNIQDITHMRPISIFWNYCYSIKQDVVIAKHKRNCILRQKRT